MDRSIYYIYLRLCNNSIFFVSARRPNNTLDNMSALNVSSYTVHFIDCKLDKDCVWARPFLKPRGRSVEKP